MKTIVEKATAQSKYMFADADMLVFSNETITAPDFIIGDLNIKNATLYENVTPPDDWAGCKYLFDGTNWTLDSNWVNPNLQNQPS